MILLKILKILILKILKAYSKHFPQCDAELVRDYMAYRLDNQPFPNRYDVNFHVVRI